VIGARVNSKPRKDETKSASANDGHAGAGGQAGGAGRQAGVTTVSGAEFGPVATPTAQPGGPSAHGGVGGPAAGTAADNDTVHRRATPVVPAQGSFDPFGNATSNAGTAAGTAGAARANEEEDGEHNAADYLRETDDIYGIGGMISPPVIGENQSS
jgi:hypothetical protein